jgi:glutathione peroxidase
MTLKQNFLKWVYPVFMKYTRKKGKNMSVIANANQIAPKVSIYNSHMVMNGNSQKPLSDFRGKKLLIVNTASDCGYTGQYEELEALYKKYNDKLEIIAFPANDFGEQEKGDDDAIAKFCQVNYSVTFPVASKSTVIKNDEQNEIFKWLTDPSKNGWNNQQPTWNFSKYLLNEEGVLTHYFDPAISPLDMVVVEAIDKSL